MELTESGRVDQPFVEENGGIRRDNPDATPLSQLPENRSQQSPFLPCFLGTYTMYTPVCRCDDLEEAVSEIEEDVEGDEDRVGDEGREDLPSSMVGSWEYVVPWPDRRERETSPLSIIDT
jgi:hypothetical protein